MLILLSALSCAACFCVMTDVFEKKIISHYAGVSENKVRKNGITLQVMEVVVAVDDCGVLQLKWAVSRRMCSEPFMPAFYEPFRGNA